MGKMIKQKETIDTSVKGSVSITKHYNDSGTSEIVFKDEENIIVNSGGRSLLYNMIPEDGVQGHTHTRDQYVLDKVRLGNDTGSGNVFDPELPVGSFDGSEQNVLIERDIEFFRLGDDYIGFNIPLDNEKVFEDVGAIDNREGIGFTSLTLWTKDGKLFAYKRFPVVFITYKIDFTIDWKIEWVPVS